jgi:hypothetical protein
MRSPVATGALLAVAWTWLAKGQEPAAKPEAAAKPPEQAVENAAGKCLEPPPLLLSWQDYHGPYQKLVGAFARKLERKSVNSAQYKPGTVLCTLKVKDKFMLFVNDSIDPVSFLSAGFDAGLDQASDRDPSFGQGWGGYGKRFLADYGSQTDWRFFTDFAYPTIFSEDPRYYPLGEGTAGQRLLHAAGHTFVAHHDNGAHMFNFSLWLGTGTAILVTDFIHPGNSRRIGPGLAAAGNFIGMDMGFDVIREFAPEIAKKLHLPFRNPNTKPKALVPGSSSDD